MSIFINCSQTFVHDVESLNNNADFIHHVDGLLPPEMAVYRINCHGQKVLYNGMICLGEEDSKSLLINLKEGNAHQLTPLSSDLG